MGRCHKKERDLQLNAWSIDYRWDSFAQWGKRMSAWVFGCKNKLTNWTTIMLNKNSGSKCYTSKLQRRSTVFEGWSKRSFLLQWVLLTRAFEEDFYWNKIHRQLSNTKASRSSNAIDANEETNKNLWFAKSNCIWFGRCKS